MLGKDGLDEVKVFFPEFEFEGNFLGNLDDWDWSTVKSANCGFRLGLDWLRVEKMSRKSRRVFCLLGLLISAT